MALLGTVRVLAVHLFQFKNTMFEGSQISIPLIIKLLYKYITGSNFVDIEHELEINRETISNWKKLVHEAIIDFLVKSSSKIGGEIPDGTPKIVEIDESLFFKRKYNRGRVTEGTWYIGGIERGSRNIFMVPVSNRNANTCLKVISDHVLPGTKIITDEWKAYKKALNKLGVYFHDSANHSLSFVDPYDKDVHTQNIEGLWSRSKSWLRKKSGIQPKDYFIYINQFMWEYKVEKYKRFSTLLTLLSCKHCEND